MHKMLYESFIQFNSINENIKHNLQKNVITLCLYYPFQNLFDGKEGLMMLWIYRLFLHFILTLKLLLC